MSDFDAARPARRYHASMGQEIHLAGLYAATLSGLLGQMDGHAQRGPYHPACGSHHGAIGRFVQNCTLRLGSPSD